MGKKVLWNQILFTVYHCKKYSWKSLAFQWIFCSISSKSH